MFTPNLGEDVDFHFGRLQAYAFQDGLWVGEKPPQPLLDSPSDPEKTQDLEVFACVFREGGSVRSHLVRDPGTSWHLVRWQRLPGFVYGWYMDGFWRFVGLNVTNLYESWFCLKLTSLKMGHVSVVEF